MINKRKRENLTKCPKLTGCPKLPRLTVQTHTIIHIKNNNRSEQEDVNILSFELNGHIILKKADCFTLISTLKKASRYFWGSPASVLRSKHGQNDSALITNK